MTSTILELASRVLRNEARILSNLADVLGDNFVQAVRLLASCSNRLVLTGVGKSSFVARQIAATFVRTGMPSLFVHPTDAVHGDLGAIAGDDLVLAISSSGQTAGLLHLIPHLRKRCRSILAIIGKAGSPLAKEVDLVLQVGEADDPLIAGPIGSGNRNVLRPFQATSRLGVSGARLTATCARSLSSTNVGCHVSTCHPRPVTSSLKASPAETARPNANKA